MEMKRIIALLITVMTTLTVMTVMTAGVWAEELDLSVYDDTALVGLLEQVQQEVVDRHIEKTAQLQEGVYICGRDIPVGTYVWTCTASGEDWGNVTVYSLDEEGKHDKQLFWEIVSTPEEGEEQESFLITVNDGEELSSQVPFSLTIYAGAVFQ